MVTAAYLVTGEIAGTRRRAERLRQEITAQLSDLPRDGRLEIDLSGLTVMSGAFADELVGRLMNDRPGDSRMLRFGAGVSLGGCAGAAVNGVARLSRSASGSASPYLTIG